MVGKNNHIRTVKSNLKEHYKAYKAGRRWVYASLASLALGAGLLLGSTTAFADDAATTQDPATSVTKDAGSTTTAAQAASTAPLKASTTVADTSNTTATDSSNKQATVNANESANADVKPSDTTPANVGKGADTAAQDTPATTSDTTATKPASTPTADATPADGSSNSKQSAASKTLVDPTEEQLSAAKASAEKVYDATHQAQEIDAVADDSTASLTLSATAIGHGTNAKSPLTLTLTTNGKAGDVYVINIPANTQVYSFDSADPLVSAAGTTTVVENTDGSHTVTDTFTADSTTSQLIKLNLGGNYAARDGGMPDVGKTLTKTITWSIKHAGQNEAVAQTPLTFTQTIQPTTNLTTVSMIYPDGKQVSQILPNQNYVFSLGINEANGIQDDSYKTPRVNSADNYGGSTVTIPVPTGFVLDTTSTNQINRLTDGSTITQPGGKGTDVIITVPAKAGNQGWQDGTQPYKIVGAFDVPQTTTVQTLTAPGDVTFSQIMNSDGDKLTASADPWSVELIPNQGGSDVGPSTATTTAKGNSTNTNKFVLDTDPTDDPQYLASFGFTYTSAAGSTNTKLEITIPDGLNATSIQTPATAVSPSVYLPDTTSYTYTLTLADGTTETGTVNAGDKVTPTAKSAIRTAVFVPNKLAPGANANQLGGASSFIVNGNLSNAYDDGTPVKNGDTLVSTMVGSFDANGKPLKGNASVSQTVVEATSLGVGYVEHYATSMNGTTLQWNNPGNPNAGSFKVEMGGNRGQTTYKIFEPIFYFVIPKSSTVASTNQPTGAKISEFTTDDGHTVVKFDYTGSGVTIDTHAGTGTYGTVTLANNTDALPGNYPFYMYIVSPTTKITNNKPAVDPTYVENNPNAFLMGDMGSGNWNIATASSFFNTSLAQGNQNVDAITKGTSDDQGDSTLNFYDSIVYTSLKDNAKDSNASVAINLPTVGDSKGSTYTFNLTGPIKVPDNYTVTSGEATPINATVLYSTQLQAVNANATAPDTTGYVTADQIGDNWSLIRSIIIQMKGIQPNTSTGRILISGTTDNFKEQAGKTGYLQTIFYGNGSKASENSNDASIAITGTSTIKTRYHYTDSNGDEKYIDLDDLSKTLNDNADTFTNDYPTQLSEFSDADQALIPTGYKLVTDASGKKATPTIIDGTGDEKAEFGQVAQYYYDGDFVQYELVGETSAQVKLVDDNNGGAVVGTPKYISGAPGATANWTMPTIPAGYQLVAGQATSGIYTFSANNQPVLIHVTHILDHSTKTTTRTITYVVDDPNYTNQVPETQTQKITWEITTDEVTNASVAVPQGGYAAQTIPTIPGYTATIDNVAGTATAVAAKNYGGVATSQMPKNETVTVTYTPNAQTVTVEYVDDAKGGAVVGNPTTINGKISVTATWNTDNIPAGYKLAKGQATTGTYQFNNDKNQTVKIHLSHIIDNTTATTTRTINYVVNDASYPGQAPETQTQTIIWNVATDEVTHASVAVPQGAYAAQTIPTISGYTATINNVTDTATAVAAKNYGGVATSQMPKNETVTVTYTPNAQTVTVEYVDDAKGGAVVGNPTTINGKTSGTATWNTDNMPAGYKLAKGQAASGTYQFTYETNQTIKIHLSHIIDNTTATTTRTITYVVDDPNYTDQVPAAKTQTITWDVATDEVTHASVAVPQGGYAAQTIPTISGYTATIGDVAGTAVAAKNYGGVATSQMPKNETVTVTYTPNAQTVTVEYVDDAKGDAIVGTPTIISGKTSGTATWDTTNLPAGYKLAKGQAASGTYQFTNNSDQTIKIHLNHVIDNTTATTTRTINYVVDDSNYPGQVPETQTQTITWNVTTDEVNGASVAVPQSGYSSQNAPEIPGYTPDSATVQAQNYGAAIKGKLPDSEKVTVTYTPNAQSAQVEYVDDANGGAVVGNPTTINGKTSGTATWNTDNMPTGYKLAKGQAASGTYQFTNDNQTVQIHLSHIIDNTTATTTRTITYVVDDPNYTGQVPAAKTQTITWNVATDEVNGHMVAIPQSGYAEETAPTLDGYTADPLSVAQQSYAGVTSLPDNETATVTYTPNNQTITLEYVDDDNDGAVVGTPTTLSGKTSGKVDWNTDNKPTGYSLAAGQAGSGTYQFTTGSDQLIQVHLNHVIEYTTTKTTRTVHFVVDDPNYTGQTPAPMVQTVIWHVATDKATGVSVATPQTGYYEETVPSLPGYTASQTKVGQQALGSVAASDVPMYNEDVVVTYTPDVQTTPSDGEGVPGEPTEPTGPTTPEGPTGTGSITGEIVPETPAPGEAISTTPEKGEKGSATSGNIDENAGYAGTTQDVNGTAATVSSSQSKASAASQHKLPQTNEQSHSEVGLSLLGLLTSMLGLAGLKRRKRDDE